MPHHLPHTTERGRGTLRELRVALTALVAEKGFEAVTIKDITERAGVDRTTFYLHATDKRDLFERSQRIVIDELLASSMASEPGGRIRATFRYLAEHAATYRALLTVSDPVIDQRLQEYVAQQIGPIVQQHSAASDSSIDLLATYAATVLRALAKWWLEHDMPCPPDEMAITVQKLIFAGLTSYGA